MEITNTSMLAQALSQNQHLQLSEQGGIRTQSDVAHFFQSIGDAFRSLSASGRQAIAERNANLDSQIKGMLGLEGNLPNLATTPLDQHPTVNSVVNKVIAHSAAQSAVADFPAEVRHKASLLLVKLAARDDMFAGTAEKLREYISETAGMLKRAPYLIDTIMKGTLQPADPGKLELLKQDIKKSIDEFYPSQKDKFTDKGLHVTFKKDYKRNSISSINGHKPTGDYQAEMEALVPDPKLRAFVSMMACQAGVNGALWTCLGNAESPNGMPGTLEMNANGVKDETVQCNYALENDGKNVIVKLTYDRQYQLFMLGFANYTPEDNLNMGTNRYEVTVQIPLDQTGEPPQFFITDLKLTNID